MKDQQETTNHGWKYVFKHNSLHTKFKNVIYHDNSRVSSLLEPLLDQGLTLTEWRQRYKSNLYELLQSIQADTESIRMKCESITDKISLQNTGLVTLKKDMMVTLTQK